MKICFNCDNLGQEEAQQEGKGQTRGGASRNAPHRDGKGAGQEAGRRPREENARATRCQEEAGTRSCRE